MTATERLGNSPSVLIRGCNNGNIKICASFIHFLYKGIRPIAINVTGCKTRKFNSPKPLTDPHLNFLSMKMFCYAEAVFSNASRAQ